MRCASVDTCSVHCRDRKRCCTDMSRWFSIPTWWWCEGTSSSDVHKHGNFEISRVQSVRVVFVSRPQVLRSCRSQKTRLLHQTFPSSTITPVCQRSNQRTEMNSGKKAITTWSPRVQITVTCSMQSGLGKPCETTAAHAESSPSGCLAVSLIQATAIPRDTTARCRCFSARFRLKKLLETETPESSVCRIPSRVCTCCSEGRKKGESTNEKRAPTHSAPCQNTRT